jgi:putative transposase
MGSTYSNLHYHWICATKNRNPLIRAEWRPKFQEYLGGTIRGLGGVAINVGGVEDHVHALIGLKTTHCIADFVRELKKASSVWAAESLEKDFAWQEGYSMFTVSASRLELVHNYIGRQEEHHRKKTFTEELKEFLIRHGIEYDPKYLE